jgi:hypothetical protein
MALRQVVEDGGNRLALQTWPHLRDGVVEEGYALAFSSEYTEAGPTPTYPMIVWLHPPDAEDADDWRRVSPQKWDGISEVTHQGQVVYRPTVQRETPPPPRVDTFQQEFNDMQDSAQTDSINRFMAREQSRTRKERLVKVGVALAIGVAVIGIYLFYF